MTTQTPHPSELPFKVLDRFDNDGIWGHSTRVEAEAEAERLNHLDSGHLGPYRVVEDEATEIERSYIYRGIE